MAQDTAYTDSQNRAYKFFKKYYEGWHVHMEYVPKDLIPFQDIKLRNWSIDIAVISEQGDKYAIEVDGLVHNKQIQARKDADKRQTLAWNGWKVKSIPYEYVPKLWSGEEGWEQELKNYIETKW